MQVKFGFLIRNPNSCNSLLDKIEFSFVPNYKTSDSFRYGVA
ncbi:hypothetical protein VCHA34P116_20487 [Vibrio chagasii]|nr:hypothetical protein VCHA35O137_20037 [Vibrio chagasii]CAH6901405.1 hypothetical protein VCHA34P116_20487 [Vibrio chagasii]CAH6908591.1 hypothetical protein VCHA32P90_20487 [Vibrio chagasii]CAH7183925.1 hypothetical protein VCHA39P230_20036 [Vibrio chagasii]CAH7196214.1 hypothetical protein VCHA37P194_20036 [Vibrio chagasii]